MCSHRVIDLTTDDDDVADVSPNQIADCIVDSEFQEHFQTLREATQTSAPMEVSMYATSRLICLRHCAANGDDDDRDECSTASKTNDRKCRAKESACICNRDSGVDKLLYRTRVISVSKSVPKRQKIMPRDASNTDALTDPDADSCATIMSHPENYCCSPIEQRIYAPVRDATQVSPNKHYCVYLLQSTTSKKRTYCGVTNNRARRIRQHNGLIVGGAKQTRGGRPWRMFAVLNGFTKRAALQFEWSMHHPRVRKLKGPHYGVRGRLNCMWQLLQSDVWREHFSNEPIRIGLVSRSSLHWQCGNEIVTTHVDGADLLYDLCGGANPWAPCDIGKQQSEIIYRPPTERDDTMQLRMYTMEGFEPIWQKDASVRWPNHQFIADICLAKQSLTWLECFACRNHHCDAV